MPPAVILLPVFALVALYGLSFAMLVLMRQRAFARGTVTPQSVALGEDRWPASAKQASGAYSNLFEMPVLFFALVPLAMLTHTADHLFVALAWVFVFARAAQLAIHLTANVVIARGSAFFVGTITLFLMWVLVAVRVLVTPFFLAL